MLVILIASDNIINATNICIRFLYLMHYMSLLL